jgi:hypothetical protein
VGTVNPQFPEYNSLSGEGSVILHSVRAQSGLRSITNLAIPLPSVLQSSPVQLPPLPSGFCPGTSRGGSSIKLLENLYVNINVNRYAEFVKTRIKLHPERFSLFERNIGVSPKCKNIIVNTLLTLPQQVLYQIVGTVNPQFPEYNSFSGAGSVILHPVHAQFADNTSIPELSTRRVDNCLLDE